jgi:hypothetical protein
VLQSVQAQSVQAQQELVPGRERRVPQRVQVLASRRKQPKTLKGSLLQAG